jgi:hypothetical protein
MAAAAHDPEFAAKVGIPQKVAKEFNRADTGGPMLHASRPKTSLSHVGMKPSYGERK